jgi:hypothetical protein
MFFGFPIGLEADDTSAPDWPEAAVPAAAKRCFVFAAAHHSSSASFSREGTSAINRVGRVDEGRKSEKKCVKVDRPDRFAADGGTRKTCRWPGQVM